VLAFSDIMMEEAVSRAAGGVQGLDLPSHLMPSKEGQLDLDALLNPAVQQVATQTSILNPEPSFSEAEEPLSRCPNDGLFSPFPLF